MSDSLRDQLKQAGFAETKPKARNTRSNPRRHAPNAKHSGAKSSAKSDARSEAAKKAKQADADKAARKAKKIAITELIEEHQIKKFAGESVYSYTLEKKIRQLFVTDEARTKLIDGDWVITRLNGSTYLVPTETGKAIIEINPQWLVVSSQDDNNDSKDYQDFPVPDDLQW